MPTRNPPQPHSRSASPPAARPAGATVAPFFWLDVGLRLFAFVMILAVGLFWGDAAEGVAPRPGGGAGTAVTMRIGEALSTIGTQVQTADWLRRP